MDGPMFFNLKLNIHMRKIVSLLSVLMLLCASVFGQGTRVISGQVRDEKGDGVPFATVAEANSKNAVKADGSGFFTIKISNNAQLTISAVGYQNKTVTPSAAAGNQVFSLTAKTDEQPEVVVTTALGIKRRPKEIGYANTTLKNDQITVGKSPTIGQALSGKVAGLTVFNTSSSVNASPRITLRGNRSITGNNQALIVLDGVPVPQNTINYLNPNDIESVTVLKGGQSATIYGSDGVNGASVITTRKGGGKPQVAFTHTSNFEDVAYLPEFQTEYGSGSGYGLTMQENFRPFENQQYGDHYDGSIRAIGRRAPDGTWLEIPYSFIPGIREKVWDRGYTMQNDISVSGGDANSSYYLSFQDVNTKGIVPKDEYRRDAFRFNASKTYGKFKAAFDGTYTMDRAQRTTSDFYFFAINTPGWAPIDQLKDWKNNKFANPNGYFNDYYNNPWFELDNNRSDNRQNYFNGNISLNFKPLSWLEANYRLGAAVTNAYGKSWTNRFDYSDYAKGLLPSPNKPTTKDPQYNDYSYIYRARNAPVVGGVGDSYSNGTRINSDFTISMNKDFGDFSGKLLLGNNLQVRRSKDLSVGSTSVIIPDLFNVSNRSGELTGGESNTELRKVGNFADLTMGYKDYLFLHGTFRYDMSSVFYKNGRAADLYSYPYYGVDASFVVSDMVPAIKGNILSFLKVRAGWNRNGNDNLGVYQLDPTFSTGAGFPYGSVVGATVDNTFPDPGLKPEFVTTTEVGFESQWWKNRINLDATFFTQDASDQVLNVAISSATGYTSKLLNAAKLKNWGAEVEARGTIFRNKDWTIDLNANYTFNDNEVKALFGGLTSVQLNSPGSQAFVFAELGKPFPLLKTTYYAIDSATGKTIIDPADGWPIMGNGLKTQGVTTPKHQLGVGARISWKNFTATANAEYRSGNFIYHDLAQDMGFTGSGQATNLYHRQQFIWPNSTYFDGSKYVNNTSIPVQDYLAIYQGWGDYGFSRGTLTNGDFYTTSAAFWKIRDISLSYQFPQSVVNRLKVVKGMNLSVFGRNMFTWLPKENMYTDPEFSTTNGNGIGINNSFNTPPVRQYGATLNVNF
jgi:TonB-linked SusC/RagA family outer membrane protein